MLLEEGLFLKEVCFNHRFHTVSHMPRGFPDFRNCAFSHQRA